MTTQRKTMRRAASSLLQARATARATVAHHWPDLAAVEPTVTRRASDVPQANDAAYVFTFATELRTPEGYAMPRVARVTVNQQCGEVVKAVISR